MDVSVRRYDGLLRHLRPYKHLRLMVVIEIAVPYLKINYPDLSRDWKAWVMVMLRDWLDNIGSESNIVRCIDGFINYYKTQYQRYITEVGYYTCDYDRDYGFVRSFLYELNWRIRF